LPSDLSKHIILGDGLGRIALDIDSFLLANFKGRVKIDTLDDGDDADSIVIVKNGVLKKIKNTSVRSLKSFFTPIGNITTGEDDLQATTIAANKLSADGDYIDFEFSFDFAANANNKQIKLYVGGTQMYATGAQAQSGGNMVISGRITKTAANTVYVQIKQLSGMALFVDETTSVAGALTLTSSFVIKCTGEATATNDIVNPILQTNFHPAN